MANKLHKKHRQYKTAILILSLLIIFLLGEIWILQKKYQPNDTGTFPKTEKSAETSSQIEAEAIIKPTHILKAEDELKINRTITKDEQGIIKITAHLENLEKIDKSITINDLVETIKFDIRADLYQTNVEALNGTLFPQNNKPMVSSFGPGPSREKKTQVTVSLLNLNFTNATSDNALYELEFLTSHGISTMNFETEIRTNQYIMKLNKNTFPISTLRK